MNNMDKRTKKLVTAAIIGAAYAALTVALAPISYGPIQFRVSEVLCILPFFLPFSTWGLFVGCVVANLFGGYGVIDVVFGSLATLLASLCAAGFGKSARAAVRESGKSIGWGFCVLACAMPVVFNAPIIGAVISYSAMEYSFWTGVLIFGAQVGLGEAGVMFVLGLPLMRILLKNQRVAVLMESF